MTATRQEGDYHVNGHLTMKTGALPAGTVNNNMVNDSAGIEVTKMRHQYEKTYSIESATALAAGGHPLHIVHGTTGEILAYKASVVVAAVGVEDWDVELKKNGTTVLTTAITLNSSVTAFEIAGAVLGTTALVAGDVLEAVFTETNGGGTEPKGVIVEVIIKEDAV